MWFLGSRTKPCNHPKMSNVNWVFGWVSSSRRKHPSHFPQVLSFATRKDDIFVIRPMWPANATMKHGRRRRVLPKQATPRETCALRFKKHTHTHTLIVTDDDWYDQLLCQHDWTGWNSRCRERFSCDLIILFASFATHPNLTPTTVCVACPLL